MEATIRYCDCTTAVMPHSGTGAIFNRGIHIQMHNMQFGRSGRFYDV